MPNTRSGQQSHKPAVRLDRFATTRADHHRRAIGMKEHKPTRKVKKEVQRLAEKKRRDTGLGRAFLYAAAVAFVAVAAYLVLVLRELL